MASLDGSQRWEPKNSLEPRLHTLPLGLGSSVLLSAASPPGARNPQWLTRGGQCWGSSQQDTDLYDGTQFRNLRMLEELDTDPKRSRDMYHSTSGYLNFHQ